MGWLSLIGAGVSAIGQHNQGVDAQHNANLQANDIEQNASAQATKLRKVALQTRGASRAALAASGVDVNTASSNIIDESITRNSEADAYNIILNGEQQASAVRRGGSTAATAGNMNAASTLGAGLADYYSGWKKAKAATNYGVT